MVKKMYSFFHAADADPYVDLAAKIVIVPRVFLLAMYALAGILFLIYLVVSFGFFLFTGWAFIGFLSMLLYALLTLLVVAVPCARSSISAFGGRAKSSSRASER